MQGIEVLYWALSVVFCLALLFAILFWCRSWRNEERESNLRQLQQLAREVRRLSEAIEGLENTSASLQTADEQLSLQIENIRNMGRDLKRQLTPSAPPPVVSAPKASASEPAASVSVSPTSDEIVSLQEASEDRYAQARDLLLGGEAQTDVARQLDLGTAEVRMIARLLEKTDDVL